MARGRLGMGLGDVNRDLDRVGAGTVNRVSARAVSYTHLRAHETVLDLVCRLLLEKKKTKISN